jgi:hypothetical protein
VEDRTLLSTFLVMSTGDSGPGSLRQAILDSNAATDGSNTIDFKIPGHGVQTIAPASPLPAITQAVLIDGTSQPGYTGRPLIAIDASFSGMSDDLTIIGSAVTLRGLANVSFALGSGAMPDDMTLQSVPLEASHGGNANPFSAYRIDTSGDGRLLVQVHSPGVAVPLSLLDAQGRVLVESAGLSLANLDSKIDQHLSAGTYFLRTQSTGGTGEYSLKTVLTPASPPFQPIPVGAPGSGNGGYDPLVVGDFNGDGIPDLAAMDGVHLGLGDGTFREPSAGLGLSVGNPALDGLVAGDFNGDGKLDLAVRFSYSNAIAVLLGNGDGTFQAQMFYAVGTSSAFLHGAGTILVAGDFTRDGHLDLATANSGSNDISVLLGNGDGTFQPAVQYAAGQGPDALVAGDFTGDGHVDLAVANNGSNDISVLLGNGDGTFQAAAEYAAGNGPVALAAGDFRGVGKLDLAVADGGHHRRGRSEVSVLLGNGDGTFQAPVAVATGLFPESLVVGDFNGDGHLDLATASHGSSDVSVLAGNGDGTFQVPKRLSPGVGAFSLAAGDFNRDGKLDLATADYWSDGISVLLNNGDGTFVQRQRTTVGSRPGALATGDFNGDGRLDLATTNLGSGDISVLLGNGDGTFQAQQTYARGLFPGSLVTGDFNGDGRLDMVVSDSGGVSELLGNGDGTFQPPRQIAAEGASIAGDFNQDGKLDLTDGYDVLLGNGDGTFQPAKTVAVGGDGSLAARDFNGDGKLDLAGVDEGGGVRLALGNGDGTFQPVMEYAAGLFPYTVVAGDFNGDGKLDLATSNLGSNDISVLLGNGDGTFQTAKTVAVGIAGHLVARDFNGDGRLDLAVSGSDPTTGASEIAVLLGNGDGTFQPAKFYAAGKSVNDLVAGDFNGDGKLDLAAIDALEGDIIVFLGNGDGTFSDPGQFATTAHATPLVADVHGDGTDDVLVFDGHGNILYRQGVPGQPGSFEPPVTVNPGNPSRDIAWVPDTSQGPMLASVDAHDDAISFYAYRNGGLVQIGSLATGKLPAQIIAADLNGDGLTDLVVRNAGDGTLLVFYATPFDRSKYIGPLNPQLIPPSFLPPVTLPVGIGASDVQSVDSTGGGTLDLVVTNKLTGQVTILHNLGDGTFAAPVPYRAGTGLSAIDPGSTPEVTSQEETGGVAAGPLTPGGLTSLMTANPGSNTMGILAGLGGGRFANPVSIETPAPIQFVRMGDFTGNGVSDLAALTAHGVSIYLGDGKGGFSKPVTYDAGPDPTGLTVADLNHNGHADLLIGNAYGDVLILGNQGNGTFAPYREADQAVTLAVADLTGNGSKDVIFADQGLDRVVVDYGAGKSSVLGNQASLDSHGRYTG